MTFGKKEKFSIRKLTVGTASVLVGTLLWGLPNQSVFASEHPADTAVLAQAGDASENESRVLEAVEIASPVTYVADATKAVGYHEVVTEGQAGRLIISETDSLKSSERIEPTSGHEIYGTKPEIEEVILETATTEYVANEELEAGTQVVKQEGQDGKEIVTKTYRILETELYNSSEEEYIGKTPYTIDDTKSLPSDKIVIDEEAIISGLSENELAEAFFNTISEMNAIVARRNEDPQNLLEAIDAYFQKHSFSPEQYADIKAIYTKYKYFRDQYSQEELIEKYAKGLGLAVNRASGFTLVDEVGNQYQPTSLAYEYSMVSNEELPFTELKDQYLAYLKEKGIGVGTTIGENLWIPVGTSPEEYLFESNSIKRLVTKQQVDSQTGQTTYTIGLEYLYNLDNYGPTDTIVKKRYLNYLKNANVDFEVISDSQLLIDGVIYTLTLDNKGIKPFTLVRTPEHVREQLEHNDIIFEALTKRYNNLHGYGNDLNVIYQTERMPEEERLWFNQQLEKLPLAIKKNLVRLVILDDSVGEGQETARGISYTGTKEIRLRYPNTGSKEDLLRVFLHELSHVIDNNSSGSSYGKDLTGGLSSTEEFMDFYRNKVNPILTEPDVAIKDYYKAYPKESLAEFFGEYLLKRLYGYDYAKFIEIDGVVYTLRPYDFLDNSDDIEKGRELTDKYYNDPRAYSPIQEAEWFFEKLYTLLFEQPTKAEVVVDQITTEVVEVKNKIVEVGTKPEVAREVTKYRTVEIQDSNLLIGERKVVQVGRDGIIEKTTTYELVDKSTGEIVATTTSAVIQELVEEIIAVGTKVSEATEEEKVSAIPDYSPVEETKPEYVFNPADFQDIFGRAEDDNKNPVVDKSKTEEESRSELVGGAFAGIPEKPTMAVLNPSVDISSSEILPTYSRVARAKALPETGADRGILMSLLGFVSLSLGVGATGKRRRR